VRHVQNCINWIALYVIALPLTINAAHYIILDIPVLTEATDIVEYDSFSRQSSPLLLNLGDAA
jgi:hypothetical protein